MKELRAMAKWSEKKIESWFTNSKYTSWVILCKSFPLELYFWQSSLEMVIVGDWKWDSPTYWVLSFAGKVTEKKIVIRFNCSGKFFPFTVLSLSNSS